MSDEERRRFGPPVKPEPPAEVEAFEYGEWPPPLERPAPYERRLPVEDDPPRVGWLAALLGLKRRERLKWRTRQLGRAITEAPEAPVNYVLRGELWLRLGQREKAAHDFQKALLLAEPSFAASDWGLVAQALSDRALMGLRRAGYVIRPARRSDARR